MIGYEERGSSVMHGLERLTRRVTAAAGTGLLATGALLVGLGASGAGAASGGSVSNPYSPAYQHPARHGVVPTRAQEARMKSWAASHGTSASTGPETLSYGGGIGGVGVTVSSPAAPPKVYVVFWGSQWGTQGTDANGNLTFSNDTDHGAPYIQNLFRGLGTNGELWSGTMTQYCNGVPAGSTSCPAGYPRIQMPSGGVLAGVWYDGSTAAPSAATEVQIADEAVTAAGFFGNTSTTANRGVQYDILSAPGTDPDNYLSSGFCAWHDYTGDTTLTGGTVTNTYGNLAFTNMPYVMDAGASCGMNFVNSGSAGTLDGYSIVNGHEYAETVTDQFPAGGWTNHQPNSYSGEENGDECAWIGSGQGASANVVLSVGSSTGSFAMQSTWSNDTNRCDISHPNVSAGPSTNTVTITSPTGSQSNYVNRSLTLQVKASDSSGATAFTYAASGLPRGLTINSSTGLISGTPNRTGTWTTTVKATDSTGASGSFTFSWKIHR